MALCELWLIAMILCQKNELFAWLNKIVKKNQMSENDFHLPWTVGQPFKSMLEQAEDAIN